jgi:CheY-specific phosphatase CheX
LITSTKNSISTGFFANTGQRMKKNKIITTDDILLKLCQSISSVLSTATDSQINYSAMVQKINKTSLKPDIGCFVLFDGGFTGLVVSNFTQQAALEIYQAYMLKMGIPQEDLAIHHTSDEVADVLGELMNQTVGDFTSKIRRELQISITQNQPKMLALNKQIILSVDTNLDRPQARRVSFTTEKNNIFYLELAMDKTEFIQLEEFEQHQDIDPDVIIENTKKQNDSNLALANQKAEQDLLDELGI